MCLPVNVLDIISTQQVRAIHDRTHRPNFAMSWHVCKSLQVIIMQDRCRIQVDLCLQYVVTGWASPQRTTNNGSKFFSARNKSLRSAVSTEVKGRQYHNLSVTLTKSCSITFSILKIMYKLLPERVHTMMYCSLFKWAMFKRKKYCVVEWPWTVTWCCQQDYPGIQLYCFSDALRWC